jgi:hypothetical protein
MYHNITVVESRKCKFSAAKNINLNQTIPLRLHELYYLVRIRHIDSIFGAVFCQWGAPFAGKD